MRFQKQGMPPDTTKGSTETNKATKLAANGRRLFSSLQDRLSDAGNQKLNQTVLLLLTALFLTFLIIPNQHFHSMRYAIGDIAPTDIKATQSYLLEDAAQTEKIRSQAENAVPSVYVFQPAKADDLKKRFSSAFAQIIDARSRGGYDRETVRGAISGVLGFEVSSAEMESLEKIPNFRALLAEIGHLADTVYKNKVVADRAAYAVDRTRGVLLFESETGNLIGAGDATITVIDLNDAAGLVHAMRLPVVDRSYAPSVKALLFKALQPNLTPNAAATEAKRREARNSVRPVVYQIKRGEMIVREGERISEEQALKLNKSFRGWQRGKQIPYGHRGLRVDSRPVFFSLPVRQKEYP